MSRYGFTYDSWLARIESQGGKCAICDRPFDVTRPLDIHVDHDHSCCPGTKTCGKCVRAILCRMCNIGLGRFEDDPERLRRAAEYVTSFKPESQVTG